MRPAFGLAFLAGCLLWGAPPAQFREHLIATGLKGGYQVVPLDVNHDGKLDLVALASGMDELVWFENPGWRRHVMAGGLFHMINLAACNADDQGIPEIVVAHAFANQAKDSLGIVSVLRHNGDPTGRWTVMEIDRLPTSHRLRCADIDGSGKKVVINAPLTGARAEAPDYRDNTPLVFYRPGEWKRQLIGEENRGVVHGIYVLDWDQDGRDEILTASFVGIHLYRRGKDGHWTRTELTKGDPSPWPKSGASDIAVGQLGRRRYLASIEPWHGNQVVVYRHENGIWRRAVIDDTFVNGHTIVTADLNGDGRDEIVAGYRGQGQSVFIYQAEDSEGAHWSRRALDHGGIAAAACAAADLNGDQQPDIACIGSATANLKWYENLGAESASGK
jgi:hypothetical protein